MALCAWSLAATSALITSEAAQAQTQSINIQSAPLAGAIRELSDKTGASIGFRGRLPYIRTREVRGAHSAAEALRQMLAGSGYRAVAMGRSSFRIEPDRDASSRPPPAAPRAIPPAFEPEIIVTALKRSKALSSVPATARVIRGDALRSASAIAGSDAIGREIPSLTISSMGPGLNRLFLRGIGDGPLNGFNQGSVAVLLDEARLNYDAPDPDLAQVDIEQVEVLEGPQGPLYGTGALGGIVKLSTRRPDLSKVTGQLLAGISVSDDSDLSNTQTMTINLPLAPGKFGIRAVAYRSRQDGWVDNVGGASDSNRENLTGGRLSIRWAASDRWTVDLTGATQSRTVRDSQYVDGSLGPLERPIRLREPRDLDTTLAVVTVKGGLGTVELKSITSISSQATSAAYDATPLDGILGTQGLTKVDDRRNYHVLDQELRFQNQQPRPVEWLAGLSLVHASTDARIIARDPISAVPLLTIKRSVDEVAAFAEASTRIGHNLTLGAGGRILSIATDDDAMEAQASRTKSHRSIRGAGDVNIAWSAAPNTIVFLRAATGFRPGGINIQPDASQPSYESDELTSIEIGARTKIGSAISLGATLYGTSWQNVQTDELLANGLIATRNAGNARNFGVEADARWNIGPQIGLTGSFMLQSAQLESSSDVGVDDPRLPAVPEFAARLKIQHGFRLGGWDALADLGIRYSGATHLSIDPTLDRRTGRHSLIDASLSLSRGNWRATLIGENLSNSREDTFAFGNPYRVRAEPQRTPVRPRTVGVSINRIF